jgi:tetratricopeptide (TPR) repeat protein
VPARSPAASFPTSQLSSLRTLEAEAIRSAEANDFATALLSLDEAIQLQPLYASAWNNRAQVKQLAAAAAVAAATDGDTPATTGVSTLQATLLRPALADADEAIRLSVEQGDAVVQRQARTQRALLLRALGGQDSEELALQEYQQAAALGGVFARQEATRLNPYAKLCNQYLQQALESHWSGLQQQLPANDDVIPPSSSSGLP